MKAEAPITITRLPDDRKKRTVKLRYVLHEVEKNVIRRYYPVGDEEKEKITLSNNKLGVRELEITDKDDPDIYAVSFYSFLIKNIDAETSGLVFKANIAFMV
jgi:hypothetical protein